MTNLAFLDTETTSLHRPHSATPGEVWDVGLILRDHHGETEHRWLLPVTLDHADPVALGIGGFHDRHPQGDRWPGGADLGDLVDDMHLWAEAFASLTHGVHLVGNVVSFDEERLAALLTAHGVVYTWHYHLVDVEALAAGALAAGHDWAVGPPVGDKAAPPWKSNDLSRSVGVDPDQFDRHTAIGDARWARAIYDAVMAGPQ